MQMTGFNTALAVCVLALLNACTTTGGASSFGDGSVVGVRGEANVVGNARIGDRVELPAGNPTGSTSADVIAEYFAASNRRCRQVLPLGGSGGVRLACENKNGSWDWVRSLSTSSVAQPLPALASVGAVSPLAPVGFENSVLVEASSLRVSTLEGSIVDGTFIENPSNNEFTVNVNETLWKFSHRTTGSGVNWQAIAELNDIDDARTLASGMTLFVPPALVQGR